MGVRQAMPSASSVVTGTETGSPASHRPRVRRSAGATTTPTTRAESPRTSRAARVAQTPDPSPIGTYTTSRSGTARNSSSG